LQQVTAANLNNHVNNATLQPGAVNSQTSIPAVASNDEILIYDSSGTTLNKAELGAIFGANIPVVASTITSNTVNSSANSDISINPYGAASVVSGSTYTSSNGTTVVVTTLAAHGLSVNQIVEITNAGTGYNGLFKVTAVTSNTFTYVLYTAATAGSGTLSFARKGTGQVSGNLLITGTSFLSDVNIAGLANLSSNVKIGGKTPMTSEDSLSKTYSKTGSATVSQGSEFVIYTSPTVTIPADETWTYEVSFSTTSRYVTGSTRPDENALRFRVYNNTTQIHEQYGSCSPYGAHTTTWIYTKSLTSADNGFILNAKFLSVVTIDTFVPYKVRLTKVKTSTLSDASTCI
jgi:hypothetical protein